MTIADYPKCPLTKRICVLHTCVAKGHNYTDISEYCRKSTAVACSCIQSMSSQMRQTTQHRKGAKYRESPLSVQL